MKSPSSLFTLPSSAALAACVAFVILHSSFVTAQIATGTIIITKKTETGYGKVELAPTANRMLRMDSNGGLILSTDGSFLTGISASNITTGSLGLARLAQGGATTGQILTWTGSAWAAQDAAGGVQLDEANTWTAAQTFSASAGVVIGAADYFQARTLIEPYGIQMSRAAGVPTVGIVQDETYGYQASLQFSSRNGIAWSDTEEYALGGAKWVRLDPGGAGVLEQYSGTTPQSYRLFNNRSGADYELLNVGWVDDVAVIETRASGTGMVLRPLKFNASNRSAYDSTPTAEELRDILISFGLMEAAP